MAITKKQKESALLNDQAFLPLYVAEMLMKNNSSLLKALERQIEADILSGLPKFQKRLKGYKWRVKLWVELHAPEKEK